jgi:hypothetical protein
LRRPEIQPRKVSLAARITHCFDAVLRTVP